VDHEPADRPADLDSDRSIAVGHDAVEFGKAHRAYGGKIVDERYRPAGMVAPLAIKDLRLALAEAEREAVPMPAASLVHDRLVGLVAAGGADLDWSALGLLEAWDAGLASSLQTGRAGSHDA
jgi:3-hydroxyisobutyrate dehydrogenase-like beta-hydroxyacid dehydrogenase